MNTITSQSQSCPDLSRTAGWISWDCRRFSAGESDVSESAGRIGNEDDFEDDPCLLPRWMSSESIAKQSNASCFCAGMVIIDFSDLF
jgi:hypothetical protein